MDMVPEVMQEAIRVVMRVASSAAEEERWPTAWSANRKCGPGRGDSSRRKRGGRFRFV